MIDPHLGEAHRDLADRFAEFGERHLRAVTRDEDDPGGRAREVCGLLGEARLLAASVPAPFGSRDARAVLVARESLAYFSLLAEMVFATQALTAHLLHAAASEIQRHRWLRALAAGSVLGTVALAEPEAGSDLSAVRTVAEADGSLWRLTGVKAWVTGAAIAGVYVVLARASEAEGPAGLALFLLDGEAPGLSTRPIEAMAALPVGELRLESTPAVCLGEEGQALPLVARALEHLRPGAAGAACGLGRRAHDEAVRHVLARRQFGLPLAAFQATQMAVADTYAEVESARRLARHAAWLEDAGAEEAPRAAAAARLVATRAAERAADRALHVHGAQGLVRGSTVERLSREVRALRLREGTLDLIRLELAETILKESR
jgi:acyl-CoA dehydrogenase